MKKRNQIVSALLTGMLAGGVASATVSTTPQAVAAYEDDESADTEEEMSGDDYDEEEDTAYDDTDAGSEEEPESVSGDENFEEEESGDEPVPEDETDDSGEAEGSEDGSISSEAEGEDTAAGAADGGTEEDTGSDDGSLEEDGGILPEEDGNTDSSKEDEDSKGEADQDDRTDPPSGTDSRDASEEEEKAREEAVRKEIEALAEAQEAAFISEQTMEEQEYSLYKEQEARDLEDAKKIQEIEEKNREEADKLRLQMEEEFQHEEEQAREEEEAEKKKKEEEELLDAARRAGYASYIAGYASSSRFYNGTYFVSEAQRRLSLNLGFKQVAKKYAVPKDGYVNIREGRNEDARIVGVLEAGSLCYILDDGSDAWSFVESGDVRGFVKTDLLIRGEEVDSLVEKTGESRMKLAVQKVDPLENQAYRYTLTTTKDVSALMSNLVNSSVSRDMVVQFARQFIGNPVVWGGNSLTGGTDCSGFTQQVFAHFGISIPRVSYEQAKSGVRIPVSEAKPGDLIFYARNGVVYHVVLYAGDGKAVNAGTTTSGIVLSNVDYESACWASRFIDDDGTHTGPSTQASQLVAVGREAYDGDPASKEMVIEALAKASEKEWEEIGFCRSVLIAQTIEESGWLAFHNTGSGIQATDNNVLGMNVDLLNDRWISPWSGASISRLVPQYVNGQIVYGFEDMRVYQDIEACMEDYAAFKIGLHPELRGVNDIDAVIDIGLRGYATNPNYKANIRSIIDKYNLTQYDTPFVIDDDDTVVNGEEGVDYSADSASEEAPEDLSPEMLVPDDIGPDSAEELPDVPPVEPDDDEEEQEEEDGTDTPDEDYVYDDVADTVYVPEDTYEAVPDEETLIPENPEEETGNEAEEDDAEDTTVPDAEEETPAAGLYRVDSMNYTPAQMELIWAIVAEEDDISYDGALAVISAVMNRADRNFGGFGRTAYDQLTADGQYCYSPSVADPIYYQRRLGGNVPDFVKQAVEDCLKNGIRSHVYNSFSATPDEQGAVHIGSNWYFDIDEPETDDFFYDGDDDIIFDEDYDDGVYIYDQDDSYSSDEDRELVTAN